MSSVTAMTMTKAAMTTEMMTMLLAKSSRVCSSWALRRGGLFLFLTMPYIMCAIVRTRVHTRVPHEHVCVCVCVRVWSCVCVCVCAGARAYTRGMW